MISGLFLAFVYPSSASLSLLVLVFGLVGILGSGTGLIAWIAVKTSNPVSQDGVGLPSSVIIKTIQFLLDSIKQDEMVDRMVAWIDAAFDVHEPDLDDRMTKRYFNDITSAIKAYKKLQFQRPDEIGAALGNTDFDYNLYGAAPKKHRAE